MTLTVNYTLSMSESLTDDSDYTTFNEINKNTHLNLTITMT